jgi:hypothetical protein
VRITDLGTGAVYFNAITYAFQGDIAYVIPVREECVLRVKCQPHKEISALTVISRDGKIHNS